MESIKNRLFSLQDLTYRDFHSKLMPTIDKERIIGVRIPVLKKLAKELYGTHEAEQFLNSLPHMYYDENNLHGFLLCCIDNYDECIVAINEFLPYVDNWATCDTLSPKCFKNHLPQLYAQCKVWIANNETYIVRFAVNMLMKYFLDEHFTLESPKLVASISSDEYYVKIGIAWYFATALAKQYDKIITFLENRSLKPWIHNKTIQKALESRRISDGQKEYLKTLKV